MFCKEWKNSADLKLNEIRKCVKINIVDFEIAPRKCRELSVTDQIHINDIFSRDSISGAKWKSKNCLSAGSVRGMKNKNRFCVSNQIPDSALHILIWQDYRTNFQSIKIMLFSDIMDLKSLIFLLCWAREMRL